MTDHALTAPTRRRFFRGVGIAGAAAYPHDGLAHYHPFRYDLIVD